MDKTRPAFYNEGRGKGADRMTMGEKIRQLRREKGLTQDALAEALEISRQAVAKWESGQSAPSTENLLKLAGLLGVPLEELAGPREQPAACLEEYARLKLEQERKRQAAKSVLWAQLRRSAVIAAGYLAVDLVCLAVFYLAGIKSCVWGWMQSFHVLPVTCLVHLAFGLLGYRRAGGALLAGTLAAIPLANIAGLAVMERTLTGRNYGWVFYLAVLFAFCGLGLVWELWAARRTAAALTRRRRAAGAALAAALSILFLACVFLSVRQVQYGLGAENGYRNGYAAGEADAAAGNPRAPGLSPGRFPENYTFGSSAYKGYAVHWSSGYNDGYDARAASPEPAAAGEGGDGLF